MGVLHHKEPLLLVYMVVILASSMASSGDANVQCSPAKTCATCISRHPSCAWCAEETYESHGVNRCMTKSELFDTGPQGCRGRWFSPESFVVTNNPALLADTTKISPVEARFKLRPGASESVIVSVKIQPEHIKRGKLLFNITIRAKTCMKKTGRVKFRVFPGKTTKLSMKVRSVCRCQCESTSQKVLSDVYCSSHGDKVCGHCECHVNYYGGRCECRGQEQPANSCLVPNTTSICSDMGVCLCGKCDCNTAESQRYGKYCECVDTNCERYDNMICGGVNRGRCMCGRCVCQRGFIGSACHIPTNTEGCVSSSGKVCDGHGACVNGQCLCKVPFHGPTCEQCLTCGGQCAELRHCVQCTVFLNGPFGTHECRAKCSSMRIDVVDMIQDNGQNHETCVYVDPTDGSYVFFQHETSGANDTEIILTVQRSKA